MSIELNFPAGWAAQLNAEAFGGSVALPAWITTHDDTTSWVKVLFPTRLSSLVPKGLQNIFGSPHGTCASSSAIGYWRALITIYGTRTFNL